MTKEELQKANANEILEELCYCGRDPYYADYYENVTTEIKNRLEQITELTEENNKLLDVINNQDVKIADLEKQIEKMKCCEICNHNKGGCSYHQNWTKECLENNHKYF